MKPDGCNEYNQQQVKMWLCACLTGVQSIALQQNGQSRANGSNVTQLNAGIPSAEFV